jgi:CDP-glycerol glycerophosphotransferase
LHLLSGEPGDTPGPVSTSDEEFVRVFRDGDWNGPRSKELRAAFRERFCAFDDGRAAERVVRHVFLGGDQPLLPYVPLAERTPAPAPSELTAGQPLVPSPGSAG